MLKLSKNIKRKLFRNKFINRKSVILDKMIGNYKKYMKSEEEIVKSYIELLIPIMRNALANFNVNNDK